VLLQDHVRNNIGVQFVEKVVRLVDIAKALNISIGTVDRALNNRQGVSPITKARVLQMAKARAYRPNLAARMLSSRKRLRISVNLPAQTASFWNTVSDAIRSEAGKHFSTTPSVKELEENEIAAQYAY
jgi:LacI family transcriptional regulator